MSRLGAVLVLAGLVAFAAGGFALDAPYQMAALAAGAVCLGIGIILEITYNSVLESRAPDDASQALVVPGPELDLGTNILGSDAWPQGWHRTPMT